MPPDKDKKFTEDFIRKWSKAGGAPKKRISKNERILKNQEEILKKDPRNHKIWFARGILLAEMGRFEEAIRCFDAAIKLNPGNKAIYNSKASALMNLGEVEEASKWYKRALLISADEVDSQARTRFTEELPIGELIRQMAEDAKDWEETVRTRTCPICDSTVLWAAKICPTCEWEFHEDDFKELPPEKEEIRPERELSEDELRERLVQKVEGYRLEGFEVAPLVRTMKTEPHRARSAVAQFEENVEEIKKFRKNLASLDTTEFTSKIKELEQLFRSPYNIFAIRNEYEKLISRIEARMAAKPRVPVVRRPSAEGLTNGMKGRVNGLGKERAIGLTNGRGRVNGMVNGRGRVNGLTNGRGRVNGMVNGRGRVNGITNGLVYRFQTMKSGLVNGLTNGNGMTNGLGSVRFQNESRMRRWKLAVIPIAALLLLALPIFIYVEVPVSDIAVDGSFDDWSGVTPIASSRNLPPEQSSIDITGVAAVDDGKYLSLYLQVFGTMLIGNPATDVPDTVHFLLDSDNDPSTGYAIRGIGSDYLIRILGHGGEVLSRQLLRYSASDEEGQTNWSAWAADGNPKADVSEDMLETQVALKTLKTDGDNVAILAHTHSYDGYSDFSDYIISNQKGVLAVDQSWSADAEIMSGADNAILSMNAHALGSRMHLRSLTIHLTGDALPSDINRLRLLADSEEIGEINDVQSDVLTFEVNDFEINENQNVFFTVEASLQSTSGNTLGARISYASDFDLGSGVASLSTTYPEGLMNYIAKADTANVEIDGGFSDWPSVINDQTNETVDNENIDIESFSARRVLRSFPVVDAFFFVNLAGRMAGGSLVPYKSPGPLRQLAPIQDSDRDTVPDSIDDFPFDFNNDNILDADTDFDFDGDTIVDYPYGPDLYLETTLPSGLPPPYANKTVIVYIGPRTAPEITGEDYMNIFLDIDGGPDGYAIGPIYADYLLSISGKNSEITYIEFLEYDGTGMEWEWKSSSRQVKASIDSHRLEAYADITLLGGDRFEIIYEASDWKEEADFATNLTWDGRSATRGSYGEYGAVFSSGSYDAYMTELADKVLFNRRDNQLSWTLPREIRWDDSTNYEVLGELIPSSLVLERSGVTYSDAYSNMEISIEYAFERKGLKENIILERDIEGIGVHGELSFLTPLQYTDGLMIKANGRETGEWTAIEGGLTFKERDATAFHIASPYSVDSSGDVLDCHYLYSSTRQLLDLRCPSNWFATATYPVFIDPSVFTLENDDATLGQAEEYLGWSTAIGDFDGDGYADIATGAPFADVGANEDAGAVYIYYGPFSGDDTSPDVTITASNTGAHLGWAIGAGIFNTDIYWDLIVTQIDNDAYAYYGSSSWSGSETTPDVTFDLSAFEETGDTENFGNAVAVGDFDNNSIEPYNKDDVAIGANLSDLPGNGNNPDGMAFIFYTPFNDPTLSESAKIAPEEHSNDGEFATSLASGKIDDDDKWDIVAGEPKNNTDDGTVHIYYGANLGSLGNWEYDDAYLDFESDTEMFGLSVAVGDMDTDGYADILVGAPGNDEQGTDAGRAYVYQANTDGTGITDVSSPDQDLTWSASNAGAELGYSVAVGDFEGDSVGDAIVGARFDNAGGALRGSILIYDNPIATDGTADYTISGSDNNETLGWSVAAGIFSSDTYLVIAAGAPFWNDSSPSENEAGRVMCIIIPENLDVILIVPLLFAIPITIRRKRQLLQFRRLRT